MFEIAFAIGIFSYSIYFLGLLGLLYKPLIISFTCVFWLGYIIYRRKLFIDFFRYFSLKGYSPIFYLGVAYIVVQALINSIGLFGPEIGFDATWYHLTLPKLYLFYHTVMHFPGGVLYYSDLPKLAEMLFTAGLSFGSDFFARSVQFIFGLLTCFVLYKTGRKFFPSAWAILIPVIFYSNLVVGWESISGYIDLVRAFYGATAFLAFLTWNSTKDKKYFLYSAVFVGLTISTKLLALPDLGIYAVAILWLDRNTVSLANRVKQVIAFCFVALIVPLPYFAFAFAHTGNPIYPMLSAAYRLPGYWQILNPVYLAVSFWQTFALSSDPINPVFLSLFPFLIFSWKKLWREIPLLTIFMAGGLIAWYATPQTGGGRYILPYLSAFSLVGVYLVHKSSLKWQRIFLIFIFITAAISLAYRAEANTKFLPLFLHKETQTHFMTSHLQFNLGDFYDTDEYFAKHIKPTDTVLLYGFHNLYYVDFPFIDSNWVKKGDAFDYVAVQGNGMPSRFAYWDLVYFNTTTNVRLYSLKGQTWYY